MTWAEIPWFDIDYRLESSVWLVNSPSPLRGSRSDARRCATRLRPFGALASFTPCSGGAQTPTSWFREATPWGRSRSSGPACQTSPRSRCARMGSRLELIDNSLVIPADRLATDFLRNALQEGRQGHVNLDIGRDGDRVRPRLPGDPIGRASADVPPMREGPGRRTMPASGHLPAATMDPAANSDGARPTVVFPRKLGAWAEASDPALDCRGRVAAAITSRGRARDPRRGSRRSTGRRPPR